MRRWLSLLKKSRKRNNMREGNLARRNNGCLVAIMWMLVIFCIGVYSWAFISAIIDLGKKGLLYSPSMLFAVLIMISIPVLVVYFIFRKKGNNKDSKFYVTPDSVCFDSLNGIICIYNPYRGCLCLL